MDYEFLEAFEAYSGIDLTDVSDMTLESALDLFAEDFDGAMEGANIDALKDYRELNKKMKEHRTTMNEAVRKSDYQTAASEAQTIADMSGQMAENIKNMPYSIGIALIILTFTGIIAALLGGLTGLLRAKTGHYSKDIKMQGNRIQSDLNLGAVYSSKRLTGDAATAALKKDMNKAQILQSVGGALAVDGLASFIYAIKLYGKKKKDAEDFTDNDRNLLLASIRQSLKGISKKYTELAAQYRGTKVASTTKSSASESWLF